MVSAPVTSFSLAAHLAGGWQGSHTLRGEQAPAGSARLQLGEDCRGPKARTAPRSPPLPAAPGTNPSPVEPLRQGPRRCCCVTPAFCSLFRSIPENLKKKKNREKRKAKRGNINSRLSPSLLPSHLQQLWLGRGSCRCGGPGRDAGLWGWLLQCLI